MSNINCITEIPFSITGNSVSATNAIDFSFSFDSTADQDSVLAYEWYLDEILITDHSLPELSVSVSCGNHMVGGRILTSDGWSGIQKVPVQTCATLPATINYTLTQQAVPYVDNNLQIKDQGIVVRDMFVDETGSVQIPQGHAFSIEAYNVDQSSAFWPTITLTIIKNGIVVFDQTIPAQPYLDYPYATLVYTDTASASDVYEVASYAASGATVNYTVVEHESPFYADANLQVKSNGIDVLDVYSNASGAIGLPKGNTAYFYAYTLLPSTGSNPTLYMTIKRNGTLIYSNSCPATPGQNMDYTETVPPGAIYELNVWATAE